MKKIILAFLLIIYSTYSLSKGILEKDLIAIDEIYYHYHDTIKPFTGETEEYWDNGQLKYKELYKNGKKVGYEEFYINGNYKSKAVYKDGLLEGLYEEFYSNGNIQSRGTFKAGSLNGFFYIYFKDGDLMHKSNYMNGEQVSCEGMCKRKK